MSNLYKSLLRKKYLEYFEDIDINDYPEVKISEKRLDVIIQEIKTEYVKKVVFEHARKIINEIFENHIENKPPDDSIRYSRNYMKASFIMYYDSDSLNKPRVTCEFDSNELAFILSVSGKVAECERFAFLYMMETCANAQKEANKKILGYKTSIDTSFIIPL